MASPPTDGGGQRLLPRPVLVIAAVLAAALLGVVIVVGLLYGSGSDGRQAPPERRPLALPRVPAAEASSAECAALTEVLPRRLDNGRSSLTRRELARPAQPGTVAWGAGTPVVLRCGLAKPDELIPTSALLEVSTVSWLRVTEDGATTWYVVDRPVYAALTVPDGFGTGPLQEVSATIRKTLPAVPVRP